MNDEREKQPPRWRTGSMLLLAFIGTLAAAALLMSTCDPSAAGQAIAYSRFLDEVRAGNVAEVRLRGHSVEGRWDPESAPASASEPPGEAQGGVGRFRTTVPTMGDDALLPLLREQGVTVRVDEPSEGVPWTWLLIGGVPLLFLLFALFASRGGSGGGAQDPATRALGDVARSGARRYVGTRTGVSFDQVAGADEAKAELVQVVKFLREPEHFHALGARIPKGVLLVGAPGTGKTLLAKAVAGEAGVPFFSISGSEFLEVFVGVGASRVRDLFRQAKRYAPCIVFIDELDAVGRQRGAGLGGGHDEREQTLNQILVEMDGFEARDAVVVLAATNRPDVLDPALVRPGRFDRQVMVSPPDRVGREAILAVHAKDVPLDADVRLEQLARMTVGFTGADLANLVNEAAILAAQEDARLVSTEHFSRARERILLGPTRPLVLADELRRLTAYHEAGHAVVAHLSPGADPVEMVTIVPHSQALGVTQQTPDEDHHLYTKPGLEDRLAAIMGGRAAELLVGGNPTTGAENDLKQATRIARRMVAHWGMSERIGPVALDTDSEHPFLGRQVMHARDHSDGTASIIDEEVRWTVDTAQERALALLKANRPLLDRLARSLLEEERLSASQIEAICGPRPDPRPLGYPAELPSDPGDDPRVSRPRPAA